MLMRELHDETRRDEVLQRPSGREAEAPRSSGHWVPERGRRDSAQAAPPPPVPMGAPDDDDVAPRAAAQESGGGLPGGAQAAARGPPGQACVLKAASPTVDASRLTVERSVPVDTEAPRRACGLKAGARVSQDGHNQGRRPCQRDHRVQRPEEWLGPESPQRASSAAGTECLPAMPAALLQQLPTEAAQTGLALALARHGPPPPPTVPRPPPATPRSGRARAGRLAPVRTTTAAAAAAEGPTTEDAADGPAGRR